MFNQVDSLQWVTIILSCLLVISESLPFADSVKANGIFQAIINVMKAIAGKK